MPPSRHRGWWVPVALLVLSAIPLVFGTLRLIEVFGGPQLMPENPRIAASPAPAVAHVVGGGMFLLLGAFQVSSAIRKRWLGWHRGVGRTLVALGLTAALAGLWMTLFYPRQSGTGPMLQVLRVAFAAALAISLLRGYRAIRSHDVVQHRAWMMRAYALALGAGSQAFTIGVGEGLFGKSPVTTDLSTASGWLINLAIAEYLIRRPRRKVRTSRGLTAASPVMP